MAKILKQKEKGLNRHWKNFLDKNYLGSHNLEPGEEMLLTIEKFIGEEKVKTQDGEKVKQVLYFKESVPKMIMNIVNGDTITKLYGSHPDQWIGRQIMVYVAKGDAFGKKNQDMLRIRDVVPSFKVDVAPHIAKLETATTLDELKDAFKSLPASAQINAEVVAKKDDLKKKFDEASKA